MRWAQAESPEPSTFASPTDQPRLALSELLADDDDDEQSLEEYHLDRLTRLVGGMPALDSLDTRPLPDELSILGVATAETARVAETSALVDRICTGYFADTELRTAARRLITQIADADASIFQRGKVENAASAVAWIAAHANNAFASRTVKDMMAFVGTKTTPGDRAATMLFALGVDWYRDWEFDHALGDASLLTSTRRAQIISRRDALRAALAEEG